MNFFIENLKLNSKKISERFYGNLEPVIDPTKPTLLVLVGPTASGKTIIAEKLETKGIFKKVKTATTRDKRPHESLQDFVFMRKQKENEKESEYFENLVTEYDLIEHDEHYGYFYGIPRKSLEEIISHHLIPVVTVDFDGAESLSKNLKGLNKIIITILPDSVDQMIKRLKHRNTPQDIIDLRLSEDLEKLALSKKFTHFYLLNSEIKIGNYTGIDMSTQIINTIVESALETKATSK